MNDLIEEAINEEVKKVGLFETAKAFLIEWQHRIPLVAFIGGFILDSFTLTRLDQWLDQAILTVHLLIVTGSIVLLQLAYRAKGSREVPRKSLIGEHAPWYPIALQFSMGALFSGFFIFFTRSGTLAESWPFLLLLAGFLVGNEIFKKRYERFVFQISVYYFVILLYLILFVPVLLDMIGVWMFLLSGVLSLVVIVGVMYGLYRITPERVTKTYRKIAMTIGAIFIGMNILYFTNIIPPIPLAMKDMGIYHSVVRDGSFYTVTYEKPAWYTFWRRSDKVFRRPGNEPVYAFSAVFAPTNLTTKIYHNWEYWDEQSGEWRSAGKIAYQIVGGRDGGFRGFTLKENIFEGTWRVDVETERGQLLGRKKFKVVNEQPKRVLIEGTR